MTANRERLRRLRERRRATDRRARGALRWSVGVSRRTAIVIIAIGLAGSWLLTYVAGGADSMVPHWYYIPILFAATRFGSLVALGVALVAGVLAGPLTYVDVAEETVQTTARWLTRMSFFVGIGVLMAWLVRPWRPPLTYELRRLREQFEIRRGLELGEFFLRYEPIVSLADDAVVGMEALVRWQHPKHGELAPGAFLPAAEASPLIHRLGAHVLQTACREAAKWRALAEIRGHRPWFVAVNLSAHELDQPDLPERVAAVLADTGLPPELLYLEITEGVLVHASSVAQLRGVRQLGVKVVLDDFGTGYSSLAYLSRFPADVVKVDRTLVTGLGTHRDAELLAAGIAQLAHVLRIQVLAEGIETDAQRQAAQRLGYELGQGHFYARPLTASEVEPVPLRQQ